MILRRFLLGGLLAAGGLPTIHAVDTLQTDGVMTPWSAFPPHVDLMNTHALDESPSSSSDYLKNEDPRLRDLTLKKAAFEAASGGMVRPDEDFEGFKRRHLLKSRPEYFEVGRRMWRRAAFPRRRGESFGNVFNLWRLFWEGIWGKGWGYRVCGAVFGGRGGAAKLVQYFPDARVGVEANNSPED